MGIYLWFKIYFLIDTNTKMWTEITDLVVLRKKLLKFLQGVTHSIHQNHTMQVPQVVEHTKYALSPVFKPIVTIWCVAGTKISRNIYALSSVFSQRLYHCSTLWLHTHTTFMPADWTKITITQESEYSNINNYSILMHPVTLWHFVTSGKEIVSRSSST